MRSGLLLVGLAWLALAAPARAGAPACDALPPELRARAVEALDRLHPYDGCDQTFTRCLAETPPAPVVLRLAAEVCRRVQAGQDVKSIEHALGKRARSVLGLGKKASITLDEACRAGEPGAPVVIAVYACARCPFCAVLVPALHRAVTVGPLQGKARLYYRPFPIKDHPFSAEGGLAMVAAARLGQFWPEVLDIYARFAEFSPDRLAGWAAGLGLPRGEFEALLADPATRAALVASKQEGVRNKVKVTPTLFLDGVEYVHELKVEAVIDVVEELFERAR
ncbi:MAG TPA: thioredoxin domain-containing protein [Myxococcota bacterium]|nr:thioredoxin domain-containing protein [Myxococcota bacterium]HRY91856.1 thioredoxin domain-containing protein [Myxococcota bacterium]HSA20557.1 thioredoxin domain-containing protein [Myxococcota bacterium]